MSRLASTLLLRTSYCVLRSQRAAFAGHAKWQNIAHTKKTEDAKRSARNNRFAHDIRQLCRLENTNDPTKSTKLRALVTQCGQAEMPKAVIERALKAFNRPDKCGTVITGMRHGAVVAVVFIEELEKNMARNVQAYIRRQSVICDDSLPLAHFDKEYRIHGTFDADKCSADDIQEAAIECDVDDVHFVDNCSDSDDSNAFYFAMADEDGTINPAIKLTKLVAHLGDRARLDDEIEAVFTPKFEEIGDVAEDRGVIAYAINKANVKFQDCISNVVYNCPDTETNES